jgi:hypothetical protein
MILCLIDAAVTGGEVTMTVTFAVDVGAPEKADIHIK